LNWLKGGTLFLDGVGELQPKHFEQAFALEVVAIVAASTTTNYAGNITKPPLEAPFQDSASRSSFRPT
jgi:hypothetical protein